MQQPERTMLDDVAVAGAGAGARATNGSETAEAQPRQAPAPEGAALYQRHASAIFAYLLKQTARREDAEDLLLEVFLAAMERGNLADLTAPEQRAWLWAVARHKAVDHFRRLTRHPSVHLRLVAETLYEDEDLEPEQVVLRQEALAQLTSAIAQLPERQQEVLRLRFGHGLSCGEMALILKKRESAVRMLLSRAVRALRALYPSC